MYNFDYKRVSALDEAVNALNSADDGKLMAGGMTILPTIKQRLANPSDLIDLAGVAELKGITVDGDTLIIGAMTTHYAVASNADVKAKSAALADLAEGIGDPAVRNRGTIGGSIANNDPAADYPAACLGLAATIRTNKREIPADDFFEGLFDTALEEDEIITAVSFPAAEKAFYMKFPNPASRYALVGAFVAKTSSGVRVAITGAGQDGVFRQKEMESALTSNFAPDAIAGISVSPDDLNSDIHASSEYRAHLIGVMVKRAVAGCT
jgi:aerobic carbon-monoxide dehydrogenase medium subunit